MGCPCKGTMHVNKKNVMHGARSMIRPICTIDGEMKTQKVPKYEVHSRFMKQQKNTCFLLEIQRGIQICHVILVILDL